jgi:hypothetical protein
MPEARLDFFHQSSAPTRGSEAKSRPVFNSVGAMNQHLRRFTEFALAENAGARSVAAADADRQDLSNRTKVGAGYGPMREVDSF